MEVPSHGKIERYQAESTQTHRAQHRDIIQQAVSRAFNKQNRDTTQHQHIHQVKKDNKATRHEQLYTPRFEPHATSASGSKLGTSGLKKERNNQLDQAGSYKTGFLLALLQTIRTAQL